MCLCREWTWRRREMLFGSWLFVLQFIGAWGDNVRDS